MSEADLAARWPLWPEGEEGRVLLDVVLDLPVDQAFLLLYGGLNELGKTFNDAVSNKEYSTTGWVDGADAVQAAAVGPTPPPLSDVKALRPGLLRRASYSGTMMGSKYRNEELHRLEEASSGVAYRVLTTVLTTAMHGEKFRPVVLTTLSALPDGRTHYKMRSTIIFIVKPNGFIRAMIDKGARDGQRKNFEALRKVLEQHTTVKDAAEALLPAAPAATAPEVATAAAAAAGEAGAAAAPVSLVEMVVGTEACRRLQPWATFLHGHLASLAPMVADLVDAQALLALLGVLSLLSALRLVVDMLLFIQHASAQPRDTIGLLTHYLFKVVDVPESMQEVLLSCLIFYTVRLLVNRLADVLPAPPAAAEGTRRASIPAAASSPGSVGGQAGTLAGGSSPSLLNRLKSEEQEAEGIKYEGYAEAIAAAQAQPLSPTVSNAATPESPSKAPQAAADKSEEAKGKQQAAGNSFMKGLSKSISDAFIPGRTKRVTLVAPEERAAAAAAAAGVLTGAAAVAGSGTVSGAASPSLPVAPPPADGSPAAGSTTSCLSMVGDQGTEGSQTAMPAAPAGGDTSPPSQSPLAVPRSLSESAATLTGELPEEPPVGSASPPSTGRLSGNLPPGLAMSPPRSMSPTPEQQAAVDGVPHSKSQGALVEQSGSSMTAFFLGKKSRSMLSPTAQPTSPQRKSGDGTSDAVLSPDQMLSPTAAQRDFRPAMPAHLPAELAGQAVIEEVFENQRLQPFRGWGHSWPGHFLPTDKVNHWSRREHDNFPVLAGPDFQAIAPPLPEGWQWCEEKWHLDLSAQIIDACDSEGWSYGLDFGFVRHPFQPNSGKKKISDFVRRRRWIRTRVPLQLAEPRATAISEDSTSWSEGREAAAAATAEGALQQGGLSGEDGDAGGLAGSAVAAAPTGGKGEGHGEGACSSEVDDERQVHAVVQSLLAKAVARNDMQSSMQEALSQQIGSRSGSGSLRATTHSQAPAAAEPASSVAPSSSQQPPMENEEQAQAKAAAGDHVPEEQPAAASGEDAEPGPSSVSPSTTAIDQSAGSGSRRSMDLSASLLLPTVTPPPVEPRPEPVGGSPVHELSFSQPADDDQLVSPSQQLRGFKRSSSRVHTSQEVDEAGQGEAGQEEEEEEALQQQQQGKGESGPASLEQQSSASLEVSSSQAPDMLSTAAAAEANSCGGTEGELGDAVPAASSESQGPGQAAEDGGLEGVPGIAQGPAELGADEEAVSEQEDGEEGPAADSLHLVAPKRRP